MTRFRVSALSAGILVASLPGGVFFAVDEIRRPAFAFAQGCDYCEGEPPYCSFGSAECRSGQWQCPDCPVILDLRNDGFALTDPDRGVFFDIRSRGVRDRVAWTAPGSDDAWLVMDRNGNGVVDDSRELFGNLTEQSPPPPGEIPNGFLALAMLDRRDRGGNWDGLVDARDAEFSRLRLWQDRNRDGYSQPSELMVLAEAGVRSISLHYRESRRRDEFGNHFRFMARVESRPGYRVGPLAWDVFLRVFTVSDAPPSSSGLSDHRLHLTP
jgi:hypothetical protein